MTMATVSALRAPRNPGAAVATNGSGQALGKTWPMLGERALYGLPGEIVRTIEPETESDPAALLLSFLVAFGSLAGPGPHALANGAQHPARLFGVVVGETAKARKGGSLAQIKRIMEHVDEEFFPRRSRSGMTSGEGLIKRAADGGDKRLFVNESEFVRALVGAGRDGSTLSAVMREAWDSGDLNVMTKEEVTATGVHVCILGHITLEEAQVSITGLHAGSGFANRFLWTLARRGKLLPSGGNLDDQIVAELGRKTRDRVNEARTRGTLRRTSEAEDRWRDLYAILGDDVPGGLIGGVVARGEAQVLRLSVAYALTGPRPGPSRSTISRRRGGSGRTAESLRSSSSATVWEMCWARESGPSSENLRSAWAGSSSVRPLGATYPRRPSSGPSAFSNRRDASRL